MKTAYEVRISDGSSDVCSSDLARRRFTVLFGKGRSGTTLLWSSSVTGCYSSLGWDNESGKKHRALGLARGVIKVFFACVRAAMVCVLDNPQYDFCLLFEQIGRAHV